MRRSMFIYLAGVVLVAPHMTAGASDMLCGFLIVAATTLALLGD